MLPQRLVLALAAVAAIAYIARRIGASEKEFLKWVGAFSLFAALAAVVIGLLYSPVTVAIAIPWLLGYAAGLAERKSKQYLSQGPRK